MKTRDRDYAGCDPDIAGCDPDIAQALKQGKEVWCKIWDRKEHTYDEKAWVIRYSSSLEYPYIVDTGEGYKSAEPIKTKTIVKKASEIVRWLENNGYEVDTDGDWDKIGRLIFTADMFYYCGKIPDEKYNWLPECLEEREE